MGQLNLNIRQFRMHLNPLFILNLFQSLNHTLLLTQTTLHFSLNLLKTRNLLLQPHNTLLLILQFLHQSALLFLELRLHQVKLFLSFSFTLLHLCIKFILLHLQPLARIHLDFLQFLSQFLLF